MLMVVDHDMCISLLFLFFFFKQKTAYELRISDWSSDVCSSDLLSADGWMDVCRIAGQQHPPDPIAFGEPGGIPEAGQPARGVHAEIGSGDGDRQSVGWGKSVSVSVDLGGRRIIQTKTYMDVKTKIPNDNNKKKAIEYNIK